MTAKSDGRKIALLAILAEPDVAKARKRYLDLFGLRYFDEQGVVDLFEDSLFGAIMRDEPLVEMDRELAEQALLILKAGVKKARGGQPKGRHERLRKLAIVGAALSLKGELVAREETATQAHGQAAEEIAEDMKKRGHIISAEYLERLMGRPRHRQRSQ